MIRQPSPMSRLYGWWRSAIAGGQPPIHEGQPECGFYRTRFVRSGPWVPVEIRVERQIDPETGELTAPERFVALCDGMRRDPAALWTYLTPIPRAEHDALIARRAAIPDMAATMAAVSPQTLSSMRPAR